MINFLSFSDSAKFADIARNLVNNLGYVSNFTFWNNSLLENFKNVFSQSWTPPLMPLSIAVFFKLFGVNDFAVITTSFFYFVLTLVFIFLLAKKIFNSNLIGVLSTLVVGFNYDLIKYATGGASESAFIFEIVAASYFISIKRKWGTIMSIVLMVLMYFTRPQGFIFITSLILYWILLNFKPRKAIIIFLGVLVSGFLIDYFILPHFSGRYFLYSVTERGIGAATQIVSGGSASDSLRGEILASSGIMTVAKKIFYNLYNFYKLLPQIMSPYLFTLFVVGLFMKTKDKIESNFKIATVFMIIFTFSVVAASIPFFRYLHPVVPFIYILAVGAIVEIVKLQITNNRWFTNHKLQISRQIFTVIISCCLVSIFGIGQTFGVLVLDSRFERKIHNIGKPPIYVQLSYILRDNTKSDDVIVTNLDTWGTWYGERTTVWFPIEPKQLINSVTGEIPFDSIYLTSYKIDDENYYMGESWRLIFNNPDSPEKWICEGCRVIAQNFELQEIYQVSAVDSFEKQEAKAILLIKND